MSDPDCALMWKVKNITFLLFIDYQNDTTSLKYLKDNLLFCSSTAERKSRTSIVTKANKFCLKHNALTEVRVQALLNFYVKILFLRNSHNGK